MRQAGILAAAGLVALSDGPDGMIRRLAEYLVEQPIPDLNSGLRAFRREVSESSLLAVLKALEIQKTLGTEPVLTALRHFPAQPAEYADFPDELDPRLRAGLSARGTGSSPAGGTGLTIFCTSLHCS